MAKQKFYYAIHSQDGTIHWRVLKEKDLSRFVGTPYVITEFHNFVDTLKLQSIAYQGGVLFVSTTFPGKWIKMFSTDFLDMVTKTVISYGEITGTFTFCSKSGALGIKFLY